MNTRKKTKTSRTPDQHGFPQLPRSKQTSFSKVAAVGEELNELEIAWLSLNFILYTSWVALYSVVCEWVSESGIGVTRPNLHFFQYIQAYKPYTDPIPPITNQYQHKMTHYHQLPTSIAIYWPSTVLSSNNQDKFIIHHLVTHSWANFLWLIWWATHSILGLVLHLSW